MIVFGGGEAGRSVGYNLAKRNRESVILDENVRVGEAWRSAGTRSPLHAGPLQRGTGNAVRRPERPFPMK